MDGGYFFSRLFFASPVVSLTPPFAAVDNAVSHDARTHCLRSRALSG